MTNLKLPKEIHTLFRFPTGTQNKSSGLEDITSINDISIAIVCNINNILVNFLKFTAPRGLYLNR